MMHCPQCGREVELDSVYCRFCGASLAARSPQAGSRRFARRPDEGRLGGVCAGMAEYFDADVTFVRLVWVILALVPGGVVGGVVAYLAAWLIMPAAAGPAPGGPRHRLVRSRTDRQIEGVCGGLASYLGIDATLVRVGWAILTIVPGAIVLGVVAYLVAWAIMPEPIAALPAETATA